MNGEIEIGSFEDAKDRIVDDYPDFDDVEWSDGIEEGEITYEGLIIDVYEIELVNPSEEAVAKQNEANLKSKKDAKLDSMLDEITSKINAVKRLVVSKEDLTAVLEIHMPGGTE